MAKLFLSCTHILQEVNHFLRPFLKNQFVKIVDRQKFYCDFTNILFHFFSDMARAHLGFICYGQQSDFFLIWVMNCQKLRIPQDNLKCLFFTCVRHMMKLHLCSLHIQFLLSPMSKDQHNEAIWIEMLNQSSF